MNNLTKRNLTKQLVGMATLLVMLFTAMPTLAQNVTVHPGNGSMLPAVKSGGKTDTFYDWGGFATWKHEQLALTMTSGDSDNAALTASGQLQKPANNIFESGDKKKLHLGKGKGMSTFLTICLPKGYRFTGYTIQFMRIEKPGSSSSAENGRDGNLSFGETSGDFAYYDKGEDTYRTGIWCRNWISDWFNSHYEYNDSVYTITRTSQSESDMGNVLYFALSSTEDGRGFISLEHIELTFTAEADYAPITPTTIVNGRSAVDISFTTSKMDYGNLRRRYKDGTIANGNNGRISYDGTINDLNGNLTLYEDHSVRYVDNNGFDGTDGYVVDEKTGSISSSGEYFKLDGSTHNHLKGDTAIYFIESPIWVTTGTATNPHRNPIGYRIVSARFNYHGDGAHTPAIFYIRYESTGHGEDDGTYGLNYYSGQYNYNFQTQWRIDKEGFIYFENHYLSVNGTSIEIVDEKPNEDTGTFKVVNNQICRKNHPEQFIGWVETEKTNSEGATFLERSAVITESEDNRSSYVEVSPAGHTGTIEDYTLCIYDETGTYVKEKRVVTTDGYVEVSGYNNDAIKIGIIGTGYIKGNLTMQALDPYIDRMDIVCQENSGNGGRLSQQFNATDFSVRGGAFTFYVPESFQGPAKFTFENLYSHYGDSTYYAEPSENHSRYFFVGSTYGDYSDNVYDRYKDHRDADYTTKVACLQPGTRKFTFNNASTVTTGSGGYYEEYPFSKSLYEDNGGRFQDFLITNTEINNHTAKTAYLFTCDETRYNIAPTTATQHVYYAFYEMTIKMYKKTYTAQFNWTKIYDKDKTFYEDEQGNIQTKAMYGLTLRTSTQVTDDEGTHDGYLTVTQIQNGIDNALGKGDAPASKDQILYIDGSYLMSIVENQTGQGTNAVTHRMNELKTGLAKNALIYLPYNSSASYDNFAYKTKAGGFDGANNIIITDKNPFFAPYDIQVRSSNYAKYTRKVTKSSYGEVRYATVFMPFTIKFDEGTDAQAGVKTDSEFGQLKFLQMNTDNATADEYDYGTAFFSPSTGTQVDANTPYALQVVENKAGDSFTLRQFGSKIIATPDAAKNANNKSLFSAKELTSTGNLKDKNGSANKYTFSHMGSFSGFAFPKADPECFYFAKNGFYKSTDLIASKPNVELFPFRSVYKVTGSTPISFVKATFFNIKIGENDQIATGIQNINNKYSEISTGNGTITITAANDNSYKIFSTAGLNTHNISLKAGETRTVYVPAGIYMVNGVKVMVK